MACLRIYRELLSLATFLRVHSNSKDVSYVSWQNTYHNLKTTCHIKPTLFLWTELLKNLFLAKYLISAAATLIDIALENKSMNKKSTQTIDHFIIDAIEYIRKKSKRRPMSPPSWITYSTRLTVLMLTSK